MAGRRTSSRERMAGSEAQTQAKTDDENNKSEDTGFFGKIKRKIFG